MIKQDYILHVSDHTELGVADEWVGSSSGPGPRARAGMGPVGGARGSPRGPVEPAEPAEPGTE